MERYKSGSSLEKTLKEEKLDWLETELGIELPDELFVSLASKLTISDIDQLRKLLKEKIIEAAQ